MRTSRDVLLIDAGGHRLQVFAGRLPRLGYRAIRAKTTMEAYDAFGDPRFAIGAAVIPPDLPATDLGRALELFRDVSLHRELTFLVAGDCPGPEERRRLRDAGVAFALWEPIDQHALRFQINRALAGAEVVRGHRGALRAPAHWRVGVRAGLRDKAARVYTVSAAGAYLATAQPSPARTPVRLALPLPTGSLVLTGCVVMTNVPGNLQKPNLPVGMGVRFDAPDHRAEACLERYAQERLQALAF